MNLQNIYRAALFIAASVLLSLGVAAQTRVGTVQGTVKDPNGALVTGATVTLTQPVTGYHQAAQTDAQGAFRLVNVPFNTYKVHVEGEGFQPSEQSIDLESALPMTLDVALAVSGVANEVNITDSAGLRRTRTSTRL